MYASIQACAASSGFDEDRTAKQKPTFLHFSGVGGEELSASILEEDSVPCYYSETINKYHN
jgi:hypothetical protein